MKSFRELRVWQSGMGLVEQIYRVTQEFPRHELYGLSGQMRRAALSVPSNIAEGHTREHIREYLHHLSMAQASLAELETQVEVAGRLGYLQQSVTLSLVDQVSALGRQMYALRNSLLSKSSPAPGT